MDPQLKRGEQLNCGKVWYGTGSCPLLNGQAQPDVVETYRKHFVPSSQFEKPHAVLSIAVLCGETEEKAAQMRKYLNYIHLQFERGNYQDFGDYNSIRDYEFSPAELERINYNSGRVVSGTKEFVKAQLTGLANDFGVDEIIVTTITDNAGDRKRSFELLAEAFELT